MKKSEKQTLSREDASVRLHELADMIDNGSVVVAGVAAPVPEEVEMELEYEDEEGKTQIEFEIEWRS